MLANVSRLGLLYCLAVLLVACGPASSEPPAIEPKPAAVEEASPAVPEPLLVEPAESARLEREIGRQEEIWRGQAPDSYQIEVLHVRSIWHAQTHALTVEAGQVRAADAWCTPAPAEGQECQVTDFEAGDYLVEGLFQTARRAAQYDGGRFTKIEYDPVYGFPTRIIFDNPDIYDEDALWRVTSFQAGR